MTQPEASGGDLAEAVRFQRDLYLYWRTVAALGGLPLSARHTVGRPALRRIRAILALADGTDAAPDERPEREDMRLLYLRRLLERLRLLRGVSGEHRLVAAEAALMGRYLAHPLAERLSICPGLWMRGGWWPDSPDAHQTLPPLTAPAPPPVASARKRLLEHLAALRPGGALLLPPAPAAPRRQAARSHRHATTARKPEPTASGPDATVRAALLGPLTWMGLVRREGALARTTTAVAALAKDGAAGNAGDAGAADGLAEVAGRVVVQSDLSVLAMPPLTAPALYTLDTCAEETAFGIVAHYRLTREALARAARAGSDAAAVAARLEALSGTPLPASVRTTLFDWERHIERLRLSPNVVLLEVPDAAMLDALLADDAPGAWVARRLAPTAALLHAAATQAVRAWLLAHGEVPAFTIGTGEGE